MGNATVTGRVIETRYASTSHYGNPAYFVTLDSGETYRTKDDAMIAYGIQNAEYRDEPHVFMLTRAGRIRSAMTVSRYLATTDGRDVRARQINNELAVA